MINRDKAIAQQLGDYQAEFEKGAREDFLRALLLCLSFDFPFPEWLKDHLMAGALKYTQAKVRSLDEAFGVKRTKGWPVPHGPARRNYDLALAACLMVKAMLENKKIA